MNTPAWLVSLALLLPLAAPAEAATFEQAPSHTRAFGIDGLVTADDFTFETRTEVKYIKWWGGYFGGFPPFQDHFTIRFHLDEAGVPGMPVMQPFVAGRVRRERTGAQVVPLEVYGRDIPEYEYFVELVQPFPAEAGQAYWISIENASSAPWLWEASEASTRPGVARSRPGWPWSTDGPNAAFLVADFIIPPCRPVSGLQPPSRLGAYGSDYGTALADDFVLPHGGAPLKLTWWGAYQPHVWWQGQPDNFMVSFYEDENGHPGDLLFMDSEFSTFSVTRSPTGCTVQDPFWGFDAQPEYRYEAVSRFPTPVFPPLQAGRTYWISVRNHAGWGWTFSSQPQTPGVQTSPDETNWFAIPGSVAFDLEIEPLAAPGACSFPVKAQPPTRERVLTAEMGGWRTADDFVASGTGNLTRIEWWGGYSVNPFPHFVPTESFTLHVYADDAGRPGPVIAEWDRPEVARTATGELLRTARPEPEFHYVFDLPAPLPVEAGRRYWLSVSNHYSYDPLLWSWSAGGGGGGRGLHYAFGFGDLWFAYPSFEPQNAAFRVAVEPVSCGPVDGDGDGVEDPGDADPANPHVCRDTDADTCDDCVSGSFAPDADGDDADADLTCDAGDTDDDNDGNPDDGDNCPLVFNPLQEDRDGDGRGSVCDGPHTLVCSAADQAPAHTSVFLSGSFGYTGADDFVVARDSTLRRLVWWGGFQSVSPGEQTPSEAFTIRIYRNAPAGPGELFDRPGELLYAFTPAAGAVQRQATPDPLLNAPPPAPTEYRYTFQIPQPLPLDAGRYWVAISVPEHPVHMWGWSTSDDMVGTPAMFGWPEPPAGWFLWPGVHGLAFAAELAGGACAADRDLDGILDGEDQPDADLDGVADAVDNCPEIPNPNQADLDRDGVGSPCDGPHSQTCAAGPAQPPARTHYLWSDGIFTVADDVQLARDASVLRLQWWGGLPNGDARLLERFAVRVYDDAGGAPGTVRHTWRAPGVTKEPTGEMLNPITPVPEYRYTLDFALPVPLAAGRYWISVVAQLPSPDPWFWSISDSGLPGLLHNTGASPDAGPWEAPPVGTSMALSVIVAGDACAGDGDADGVLDGEDVSPFDPLVCIDSDADTCDDCSFGTYNPANDGPDPDGDGICTRDTDADGVLDDTDNCPLVPNPAQEDLDADGAGDACDTDDDADGVADASDNCPALANPTQVDFDRDGIGDACDADDDGDAVLDGGDRCAESVIPETTVATAGLGAGRYALVNADGVFDTSGASSATFTTAQTRGCTCAQVVALSSGEKEGHYKHGCSAELLRAFIAAQP